MSRVRLARLAGVATMAVISMLVAAPVMADQAHHTTRSEFHAVSGAPLKSGFVLNIHANGPNIFAHEVYSLKGAIPNTTFQLLAHVYFDDFSCGGTPSVSLPIGEITTNGAGNVTGDIVLPLEAANALGFRNVTGADLWQVLLGGQVVYQSECTIAIAD